MKRTIWMLAVLSIILLGCGAGAGTTPSPTTADMATPPPVTDAPATPTSASDPDIIPVSVTFDGTACTYSGPAVFLRDSLIMVAYKATGPAAEDSAMAAAALVGAIRDGTTQAEIDDAVSNLPASKWPPAWASTTDYRSVDPPEGIMYVQLARNQYLVLCFSEPNASDQVYLAGMIQVIDR
jgi:hypothetical protein